MAMAARNKPVIRSNKGGPKKSQDSVLVINNENPQVSNKTEYY